MIMSTLAVDLYCIVWNFAYVVICISIRKNALNTSLKYKVKKGVTKKKYLNLTSGFLKRPVMIRSQLVRIRVRQGTVEIL